MTFSVVPGVSRSLLVAAGVDLAAGVFWLLRGVEGDTDLELRDPHGRTALMLAVMLGKADCAKILVDAGADVNTETEGWTVVQEATATG